MYSRKLVERLLKDTNYKLVPRVETRHYSALNFLRDVDFDAKQKFNKETKRNKKQNLTFNWLSPHVGKGGGGHTTIFRFMRYLNSKGHTNRFYVVDDFEPVRDKDLERFIKENYFDIGDFAAYRGTKNLLDSDVNISTSWDTVYYSYYSDNTKFKAYLVQDFEPSFYPMSVDYVLAEQTYKMGFYHMCASRWLYKKVVEGYNTAGMFFDLGVDKKVYKIDENITRDPHKVAVYFRSWSPRRGIELIIPSLIKLMKLRPNTELVLFGEDNINYNLPFKYTNLGVISNEEIADLYSASAMTIVFSLTNYSLVPQEALACGSLVVDLDLENNRVAYGENSNNILLVKPNPHKIAKEIASHLDNPKVREQKVQRAKKFVGTLDWENSFEKVENAILDKFNGE